MTGPDSDPNVPRQLTPAELPHRAWDVVIIGAGPAGSAAALTLARRGRRVLLVDRARFPRDKVCGDALIPDALGCLSALGLLDAVRALGHTATMASLYSAARVRLDVPGAFLTIKRWTFDAFMAARAVEAGACLVEAHVEALHIEDDGSAVAKLQGVEAPIRAQSALTTTGARVELLHAHGLVSQPGASAMALRCYVRSPVRIDELVLSYDAAIAPGYAWIFPLRGDEYNVGCGTLVVRRGGAGVNLRRDFDTFVGTFPLARALMAQATSVTKLQGAMLRCGLRGSQPMGPGRWLSAGEAIGATYPLSGEGIGKSMETAVMAADAIDCTLTDASRSPLEGYEARVRRELGPKYVGYEVGQRWIGWPRVGDFVMRRAQRSAYLQRAIRGILNETVDPRAVFSVRGLIRSWLG